MGGAVVLILMAAAGLGWWLRERRAQRDELAVTAQQAQSIDVAGGLKGPKKGPGGGPWKGGGSGEGGVRPVLPGGLSCEQARDRYVEEYNLMSGDNKTPPDLTQGAYAAVLNRGSYLNACGVPGNMGVNICAAVQNGRAVGVTVTTSPPSGGTASCIAGQIRAMSFPVHPRLDIAYTQFKPE
ncbi:MAG: hypothetical protein HY744_10520 [Deltaproteobacteria bacterium]|nr:hypothetical protein [Deltaproteobacteria bacterium]